MIKCVDMLLGLCLPTPWSPSFVFPVFDSADGPTLPLIDDAGKVVGFDVIDLGVEFVPFTAPVECPVSIGEDGPIGAWLPSGAVVIGAQATVAEATIARLDSELVSFPRFQKTAMGLLSTDEMGLPNGPERTFAGDGCIVAIRQREDIEDAPRMALLDLARRDPCAYPAHWTEALLGSSLARARWTRVSERFWMAAGRTSENRTVVEIFLFDRNAQFESYVIPLAHMLSLLGLHWDALCLERAPNHLAVEANAVNATLNLRRIWFAAKDQYMVLRSTDGARLRVPLLQWASRTETFLDSVVQSLDSEEDGDEALHTAAQIWRRRGESKSPRERLELYSGLKDKRLLQRLSFVEARNSASLLRHNSELLAAARMRPHNCPQEILHTLFDSIETVPRRATDQLDALSEQLLPEFDRLVARSVAPYETGYVLARQLRLMLNIAPSVRVEPREVLEAWDVDVIITTLGTDLIDAVGFWGSRYGPGVVMNKDGIYARSAPARRATLAHEMCHLLVDRRRSLPLVDVLGGTVDTEVESRARAFAAEFLVPASFAFERYLLTDRSIHEVAELVGVLCEKFGVSRWIAGFQLKNALMRGSDEPGSGLVGAAVRYLDALVGPD